MEPNPLVIYGMCLAGAAALIFVLWLNHRLRVPPKREAQAQKARAGALEIGLSYLMGKAGPVNDYPPAVMSWEEDSPSLNAPSALETDTRQTPDRRMIPIPTDAEMLDIFRVMRAAGIKRETISGVWRAAGLPLNNNIWTDAAPPPPEAPTEKAPISGRPIPPGTKFHEDEPELQYQPLR